MSESIVIVSAARTPMGSLQGGTDDDDGIRHDELHKKG